MQVENQSMISPAPLYIFFSNPSRKKSKSLISIQFLPIPLFLSPLVGED